MGTTRKEVLQSFFPSLEVMVICDVYNQCNSDLRATIEHLRALFPEAYVARAQGQTTDQDPLPEPWTPPSQSPSTSPKKLLRNTATPPKAAEKLDPEFMQLMFPKPSRPGKAKQDEPDRRTQMTKLLRDSTGKSRMNDFQKSDLLNDWTDLNEHDLPSDGVSQQSSQPVHASLPFLQNLLPLEKPSTKTTCSCRSTGGDSTDLSPGTPPGLRDVQASAADWDLVKKHSRPTSRRSSGTSTPPGPSKKQGVERAALGKSKLPETLVQLIDTRSPSTRSSSPEKIPASMAPQMPQKPGNEGSQEHESFLQEMFPTVEVALVRDVLHNVQGDSEKACNQLLLIQNVAGCGEAGNPSCPSSEDGYASASLDGAGSRADAGPANGGVWDMSGVPVDYTFQDLTEEQKVAMIRKELPLCSVEEAHNALEACSLDLNSAIASLSQVYDDSGHHVAGSSHANLSKEVAELQKIFPSADPEALINALSVSENSVDIAKATLRANGMNPIAKPCRIEPRARSPPQRPPSSLFSPPQPADVRQPPPELQPPSGSCQAPQGRVWRRNHVDNQKLYDDHRSLAFAYKAEMDRAFQDGNRAKARGDRAMALKHRTEFEQAKINYGAAQAEAAKTIYKAKNSGLNDMPMKLDLHGLHVHEALAQLIKTIDEWRTSPESIRTAIKRLDVITGKGLHSVDNVARILHAVIQFVEEVGMEYYQKPFKDGVMIHLADTGQPLGSSPAVVNGYG